MIQLHRNENEISSSAFQGSTPMRHTQPKQPMTYLNLFLVDATFGLGV